MTNLDLYITQDIPNKQSVFGELEQKVIITSITVNWQSPTNPTIGLSLSSLSKPSTGQQYISFSITDIKKI